MALTVGEGETHMVDSKVVANGTGLKRAAIALFILTGLLALAAGALEDSLDIPSESVSMVLTPLALVGVLLYFRGRQQAAKVVAESALRGSRPHVLYLRSFYADPATVTKKLMSGFTTEEEQLADVLRPFGDLIAIGRPGEPLPLPGAVRMYAAESEWKALVLEHMRTAPLVVIRAGAGPGLAWEVGQAFSILRPEQIVILVLNLPLDEYRVFADHVREHTRLALPAIEPCGPMWSFADIRYNFTKALPGFVTFSNDWNAAFLPLPFTLIRTTYNDLKGPLNAALRPVFDRHGIDWHSRGRFG